MRERHALAYDSNRRRMVLFGGANQADTWEYDGVTWTQMSPLIGPPARGDHGMAYDATRKLVVAVTGAETWVWDGREWNKRTFAAGSASQPDSIVHDESRNRVVHVITYLWQFVGYCSTQEWDGNSWSNPVEWRGAPARFEFGAAYDGLSGGVLAFGGRTVLSEPTNETWLYSHDCWPLAPGHAGGGAPSACITPPVLGGRFCVAFAARQGAGVLLLSPGTCGDAWAQLGPPLLCAQGSLYPSPVGLEAFAAYGDPALTCKTIPFDLALLGGRLCLQGAGLELPTCFRLTDGVRAVIRLP
jgi:hypothetical protein